MLRARLRFCAAAVAAGFAMAILITANSAANIVDYVEVHVGHFPQSIAIDQPLSRAYVSLANDNAVSVVDLNANSVVTDIPVPVPLGTAVDSTHGVVLVTSAPYQSTGSLAFIDQASNAVTGTVSVGVGPSGVAVDSDALRAVVTNMLDGTVSVVDTSAKTVIATLSTGRQPDPVEIAPGSHLAYVGDRLDPTVTVINTESASIVHRLQMSGAVRGMALDPAGGRIFISAGQQISVVDASTGDLLSTYPLAFTPGRLTFNSSTNRLWVADNIDCTCIAALDASTGALFTQSYYFGDGRALSSDPVRNRVWYSTGPQYPSSDSILGFHDTPPFPPLAPVNVRASFDPSTSEVTVSWSPPTSDGGSPISGYRIDESTGSGPASNLATVGNVATYTTAIDPSCSQVSFFVSAINAGGTGSSAASPSLVIAGPPAKPTNLTAYPDNGRVRLSWMAPPQGICPLRGYQVWAATDDGARTLLQDTGWTGTGFVDTRQHTVGSTYRYWVSAYDAFQSGPLSDEASLLYPTLSAAPAGLTATTGPGRGQITLAWSAPADTGGWPVTQYNIYRRSASEALHLQLSVGPQSLSIADQDMPDGASYYYSIAAVTAAGEGARSSEVLGTTPALPSSPQNLQATPGPGLQQITLRWAAPSFSGGVPVFLYRIYRGTAGHETLVAQVSGTQFTDSGLNLFQSYHYKVTAENVVGEGPASAETCTRPFPWFGFLGC